MHGMRLLRHVKGNPDNRTKAKPKQGCLALYSTCARLSWRVPVGLNPTRVKPNQQPVTQTASVEVTKLMKPVAGSCRAATQVNVVSSEIGS
jgi:hypothetical protein